MQYCIDDLVLDLRKFELRKDGRVLSIEPQVLSLLFLLVENRDRLVSKDELVATIWNGRAISDSAISSRIKSARQLLGDDGDAQRLIRTVHGKGFRFVGEVSADESGASVGYSPEAPADDGLSAAPARAGPRKRSALLPILGLGTLLLIALIWWRPWPAGPVTIAVAPATASPESEALSRDLTAKLGMLNSVSEGTTRLLDKRGDEDPDLLFQVDASNHGAGVELNLVLVSANGEVLWSRDFQRPRAQLSDLRQQVAFTAGTVLKCALDTTSGPRNSIDRRTLKTYLNACASYADVSEDRVRDVRTLFARVTQSAPQFQAGWRWLLIADSEIVRDFDFEEAEAASDRARLKREIAAASRINPEMPQVFLAQAVLAPTRDFAGRERLADLAVEAGSDDAEPFRQRARLRYHVGRTTDAVDDARKAERLDPLSPAIREDLIVILAIAGRIDEAKEELRKAEQLWPGAASLLAARYALNLRFGDPKEAIRLRNSGSLNVSGAPYHGAFLEARANPSAVTVGKALHDARSFFSHNPKAIVDLSQTLVAFGREDELFTVLLERRNPYDVDDLLDVLFRPAFRRFHHDPRMMIVAAHLGLLQYWQSSGKWPDFCLDPDLSYDCKRAAAAIASHAKQASAP